MRTGEHGNGNTDLLIKCPINFNILQVIDLESYTLSYLVYAICNAPELKTELSIRMLYLSDSINGSIDESIFWN